jgi:hypothetical protein
MTDNPLEFYDFLIDSLNHGVYILNRNIITKPILDRLRTLGFTCFNGDIGSLCIQNPCNTYVFVYINPTHSNPFQDIETLSKNAGKIEGFATVDHFEPNKKTKTTYPYLGPSPVYPTLKSPVPSPVSYPAPSPNISTKTFPYQGIDSDYYELYNVCVDKTKRKQGIAKKILDTIIRNIPPGKNIYLMVDLRNTLMETVIKLYVSLGFLYPQINRMPSQLNNSKADMGLILTHHRDVNKIYPPPEIITSTIVDAWVAVKNSLDKFFQVVPSYILTAIDKYADNSYILIAHGCEIKNKIIIPENVRVIMRCNPVTHYCVVEQEDLYNFASNINPKNRSEYGKIISSHNINWNRGYCVANPGQEIHDFYVNPDQYNLRTGIFQVPIQANIYKNLAYKNLPVQINSRHEIINQTILFSDVISWVYNQGGGTIFSLLCRSPCEEYDLTNIKLPLLNDAIQGVPTVYMEYAGLPDAYKIADAITRQVSYIPITEDIYEESIYIDPEYKVNTVLGYNTRNGVIYDIVINRYKNRPDRFKAIDPSGKATYINITDITGIIKDPNIPYIIADPYKKEIYYEHKIDELYYKDIKGNMVYIIIPSSPYLIGTINNYNVYAAKPLSGKTVFYLSNKYTSEGAVEIKPEQIYTEYILSARK